MLIKNLTFLEQLKKKSRCPVVEKSLASSAGWYYSPPIIGSTGKRCGDGRIEIEKKMLISEKIGTLSHEMGHERCHRRSCKCYKPGNNRVLSEVHAELYALHLLLRHRNRSGIMARFNRLHKDWYSKMYSEARDIIRKRRIYKRCQEFVKTYDLLFNI